MPPFDGAAPEPRPEPQRRLAASLRGFGPAGVIASLLVMLAGPVIEPLGALLTLLWARLSRTPLRELGLVRPRSVPLTIALGIVAGAVFKLVMKSLVMPLLGAPAINPVYHYLAGNTTALPGMLFDVIVGAGFNEELVFRGFLFLRLQQLLGRALPARVGIVLGTALWFGLLHFPGQGLPGAEQALITGLVFGAVYAATGRLWPLVVTHAAFDVTAVALIYWDLETRVAHFFFR